jgi:hypothetical protein
MRWSVVTRVAAAYFRDSDDTTSHAAPGFCAIDAVCAEMNI